MEFGWNRTKRLSYLRKFAARKDAPTETIFINGKETHFHKFDVPIGLPKYRIENGRTEPYQQEYAAKNGLSKDLFKDFELPETQKAQHEVLKQFVRASEKATIDLEEYFSEDIQKRPLYLTELGVVLDGNRRLSIWRELLEKDPKKYKHLQNISVVYLDTLHESQLDEIEEDLQLQPDIKAKYTWIATAFRWRKKRDNGWDDKKIAANIKGTSEKTITKMLSALDHAEKVLIEMGAPNQWSKLDGDREAFFKLIDNLNPKKPSGAPGTSEVFKAAVYTAIKIGGHKMEEQLDRFVNNLAKCMPALEKKLVKEAKIKKGDHKSMVKYLKLKTNQEDVSEILKNTVSEFKSTQSKKDELKKAMDFVQKANSAMSSAINSYIPNKSDLNGLEEHLKSIDKNVKTIRSWVR